MGLVLSCSRHLKGLTVPCVETVCGKGFCQYVEPVTKKAWETVQGGSAKAMTMKPRCDEELILCGSATAQHFRRGQCVHGEFRGLQARIRGMLELRLLNAFASKYQHGLRLLDAVVKAASSQDMHAGAEDSEARVKALTAVSRRRLDELRVRTCSAFHHLCTRTLRYEHPASRHHEAL